MGPHDHKTVRLRIPSLRVDIVGALRGEVISFAFAGGTRTRKEVVAYVDDVLTAVRVDPIDGYDTEQKPVLLATIIEEKVDG